MIKILIGVLVAVAIFGIGVNFVAAADLIKEKTYNKLIVGTIITGIAVCFFILFAYLMTSV